MRADLYLVEGGYVKSRSRAGALIASGNVTVDGIPIKKASQPIEEGEHLVTVTDPLAYVGRGGLKLEAALDAFSVDPSGMVCIDIGASTGGFTDCLLSRGAARVYAVDAGCGQLAKKLLEDSRVVNREHLNARELSTVHTEGKRADLIVMDVSFISATYILPRFPGLLAEGGRAICLIKPQFEVGREHLSKGGIVKDAVQRRRAVEKVINAALSVGLITTHLIPSPIQGGDGNREFLISLVLGEGQGGQPFHISPAFPF